MKLVFATNNLNKLTEIQDILSDSDIQVMSLADIKLEADIPEPYDTLEENAMNKAQFVKNHSSYDCFADDTGLEIDALNGLPGVRSARFAGEPSNNEKNIDKVLLEMADTTDRTARFRTSIALILGNEKHYFEGIVEGTIIQERQGGSGFGYDPIFIPRGYDQTFAEMSREEKNRISHRGIAIEKLASFLKTRPDE